MAAQTKYFVFFVSRVGFLVEVQRSGGFCSGETEDSEDHPLLETSGSSLTSCVALRALGRPNIALWL